MLFRARHRDSAYDLTLRDTSISAAIHDRLTVAADAGGRLYSFFADGVMYRRALDGRVLRKWRWSGRRRSGWLTPAESTAIADEAAAFLALIRARLDEPAWQWTGAAPDAAGLERLKRLLDRGAGYDGAAAAIDAAAFGRVYAPIGILPPDHYLSLVLQATEGCSFNTCAFCNLYPPPFRVGSSGFRVGDSIG